MTDGIHEALGNHMNYIHSSFMSIDGYSISCICTYAGFRHHILIIYILYSTSFFPYQTICLTCSYTYLTHLYLCFFYITVYFTE